LDAPEEVQGRPPALLVRVVLCQEVAGDGHNKPEEDEDVTDDCGDIDR